MKILSNNTLIKKIFKTQKLSNIPTLFSKYLIIIIIISTLLSLFNYSLYIHYNVLTFVFFSMFFVILCSLAVYNKKKQTKSAYKFSHVLPLLVMFYIISVYIILESKNYLFFYLHSIVCFVCGTVIFFSCGNKTIIRAIIGIVSGVLFFLMMFLGFIGLVFSTNDKNTIIDTLSSPNNAYVAEVISSDQGALGGNTLIYINYNSFKIHILIGVIEKKRKIIYRGEWREWENLKLKWETFNCLSINGDTYFIN